LNFLKDSQYIFSHPQYPLFLPLTFSIIYFIIGRVSENFILLLYPLLYLLTIILAYKTILSLTKSELFSLLFSYIYSMFSPLLAQGGRLHAGSADIIITLIYWFLVFILVSRKKITNPTFITIVILISIASQIKQEGIFAAALFLFLPLNTRKKMSGILLSLLPTILWKYFILYYHIPSSFGLNLTNLQILPFRLYVIFIYTLREMLNIKNWYIFWPVFWLTVYLQKEKNKLILKTIQPTLILMVVLFSAIYIFASIDTTAYISSSADRILLQISPFFFTVFVNRLYALLPKR